MLVARQEGKVSNDYRLTVRFDIEYTGEFAENIPYEEAEQLIASWLDQDILDSRITSTKFSRTRSIIHDYSD